MGMTIVMASFLIAAGQGPGGLAGGGSGPLPFRQAKYTTGRFSNAIGRFTKIRSIFIFRLKLFSIAFASMHRKVLVLPIFFEQIKHTRREGVLPPGAASFGGYFIREHTSWVYPAGSSRGSPAMSRAC